MYVQRVKQEDTRNVVVEIGGKKTVIWSRKEPVKNAMRMGCSTQNPFT